MDLLWFHMVSHGLVGKESLVSFCGLAGKGNLVELVGKRNLLWGCGQRALALRWGCEQRECRVSDGSSQRNKVVNIAIDGFGFWQPKKRVPGTAEEAGIGPARARMERPGNRRVGGLPLELRRLPKC